MSDNDAAGILSSGSAAPSISETSVSDNGGCGVCYAGSSGGDLRASILQGNEVAIQISDAASPNIDDNTVSLNDAIGISVGGAIERIARPDPSSGSW